MKPPGAHSTLVGAIILAALIVLLSPTGLAGEEGKLTEAAKIRSAVVAPELTRSWSGPKTEKRRGYQFTGDAKGDRSLAQVDVPVLSEASISLPNIRFQLNSSTKLADETSKKQLAELAKALQDLPAGSVLLIEGHTCSRGSDPVNNRLSAERADFVRRELIDSGVPGTALKAIGLGAAESHKDGVASDAGEARLAPYRKVMIHRMVGK